MTRLFLTFIGACTESIFLPDPDSLPYATWSIAPISENAAGGIFPRPTPNISFFNVFGCSDPNFFFFPT
jgi:hypothetical protein